MEQGQKKLPTIEFPVDTSVVTATYCTVTGALATAGCPNTAVGYYKPNGLPGLCTQHAA
jgi:penicillin-binding protein 1A